MKTIIKIAFLSIILISCHKNWPKPGKYSATFTGTYEGSGMISQEFGYTTISETTEDSFYIGHSKVDKFGKNIIGEISGANFAWIKIKGVCQKKKGKYYLTGTYKEAKVDYEGGVINGEFEIKSDD